MIPNTILIIDDNATNLELLEYILCYQHYEVKTAQSAASALEILATFRPQLILMDIQMPEMNGFELIKKLKDDPQLKDIKVIAITAYAMQGDEDKIRKAGFIDYITKPIDITTLPEVIAKYFTTCDTKIHM